MSAWLTAKVSVVLCTYNGAPYLREQLESILSQSVPPGEIIVSDDGSQDSTLAIVEKVRKENNREGGPTWVVLSRKKPLGVAGNFASALTKATGDFIACADQDDVWEPQKIETLLPHFTNATTALVHSDATLIDEKGLKTGSLMRALRLTLGERRALREGRALDALLRRNLVTGSTMMMRRSLVGRALPIPEGWIHDEWLALVAATASGVVCEPRALVRYRQHAANQIGATKTDRAEVAKRLSENRTDFFARKLQRNQGIHTLLSHPLGVVDQKVRAQLSAKVAFDFWRSELPPVRAQRLIPVLRRWSTGDYVRYARGYLDVIRDLSLTDD